MSNKNYANFIWSIADLLRGSYRPHQYGSIVLPFTILRRLDAVLAETKGDVLAEYERVKDGDIPLTVLLPRKSKQAFYNTSKYDFQTLLGDAENLRDNLVDYVNKFSDNVRDIFEKYKLEERIAELHESGLLFLLVQEFAAVELHPRHVTNTEMGLIFEELIRKFAESTNDGAGDHYTPREVIRLMVDILFDADDEALQQPNVVRSVYDPTAGTGGMLSVAEEYLRELNPDVTLTLAGQELNPESYAICKADMVVKGQAIDAIVMGDTLTDDGHLGKTFNYCLSNPPFGVDWKKSQKRINKEHMEQGFEGRFGPGLPRVSDGSLLFLLHLIKKMRPVRDGGGRAAIVLNGSPLFTGGAGSGESEIRKYIFENDLLEALIALPTDMFYNTGIPTYVWILTNRKSEERKGTVQLIDASSDQFYQKMKKSLGSKRKELGDQHIEDIVKLYGAYDEAGSEYSKVFKNADFGYRTITVERPLRINFAVTESRVASALASKGLASLAETQVRVVRDALSELNAEHVWTNREVFTADVRTALNEAGATLTGPKLKALVSGLSARDEEGEISTNAKGVAEPDPDLRDTENVPLTENVQEYFEREVLPFAPDAWIDETKTKIGYEIPFTRHFYRYQEPRSLDAIDDDLDAVLGRIRARLEAVKA